MMAVEYRDMCMPRLGIERAYGCGHARAFHVIDAKGHLICRHWAHGPWFEECGPETEAFPEVALLRLRAVHGKRMGAVLQAMISSAMARAQGATVAQQNKLFREIFQEAMR